MKSILLTLTLSLFLTLGHMFAQDGYQVGDEATIFNLLNVNGEMVSPDDFPEAKGFIIVFTCNHCPYAIKYEDRIQALHEEFESQGYPVIAINPNDAEAYPSDSYDAMIVRAQEKGFTFPYLHDETQAIAKAFGATRTPHTYLVRRVEGKLIVEYIGAIDDSYNGEDIQHKYVEMAIAALESGQEVALNYTKAVGCSIKWKK